MKKILADPHFLTPGSNIISDLIYGWGNSYSASSEYLSTCIEYALTSKGPILECGSGITTIVVGLITKRLNNTIWALEDSQYWGERVQKYLNRYQIESVNLYINSLRDYGDFTWYDPPLNSMPDGFTLVVCDGPPGTTKGGRYGLLPIMKQRLKSGCVILLDDASREQEQSIVECWTKEIKASYETRGSYPYFVITLL